MFLAAPIVSTRAALMNVAGSLVTSSLSVIGVSFAFTDSSPSGRLGTAACSTTSWSSSTSVFCTGGVADPLVVTVGGTVGTMTLAFSYDGSLFCFTMFYFSCHELIFLFPSQRRLSASRGRRTRPVATVGS